MDPHDTTAAGEIRLVTSGLCILALRQVLQGTGDSLLALQYLLFGLDVNDPQVTPGLEEQGVPSSVAPALEDYVSRRLRPWMRKIDGGDRRAARWAAEALSRMASGVRSDPDAHAWAARAFREEVARADPETLEGWRLALRERRWPGQDAIRLLAAIGILQESFGAAISLAAENAWGIAMEGGDL